MKYFTMNSIPKLIFARPFFATKHKFVNRNYFSTEIIYVTEGALELSFSGQTYYVAKGESLIIPSGSTVNCKIPDNVECNSHLGLAFVGDCTVADTLAEKLPPSCIHFKTMLFQEIQNKEHFEQMFTMLIKEYSHNNTLESLSLLFKLLTYLSLDVDAQTTALTPINEVYTKKMTSFIENNYDKRISIKDIADSVQITPEYANTVFSSIQKESLLSYVNGVKTRHAQTLLRNTEMSMAEISNSIGIGDNAAYFSRFFKKNVGMTPSEFRRLIQRHDIDMSTEYMV